MQPLTYRSRTAEESVERMLMRVRNYQGWFWVRTSLKIAIGVLLSLLGPAVITGILHAVLPGIDWADLFLISAIIVIPILYYAEWRTSGNFFLDEMRAQGACTDSSYIPASYGEFRLRQSAALAALYTEILLLAPRLVFSAMFDLRQRVELTYDELCRGAEILLELSNTDRGVATVDLRRTGDSAESFRRILQYLRFHDWIGISKQRDRAWLLTTARKRM